MENQPSKFDLIDDRSDELNEIIGKKPRWIIQWGSAFAFVFILILLMLGYVIQYPDVIKAEVIVTKPSPPVRLYAKASGNIQFRVKDNQPVSENDILIILMNAGESQDLLEFSDELGLISEEMILSKDTLELSSDLSLGEFQSFYSSFLQEYNQYQLLINLEPNSQEIELLIRKRKSSEQIVGELGKRISIAMTKLTLLEKDLERSQLLFDQKAISEKDLEDKKTLVIDQNDFIQGLKLDQSNERRLLADLERELTRVNFTGVNNLLNSRQRLLNSFTELKSALSRWKHMFTISSPIDGKVSFINAWTTNQFVNEGEQVISIIPETAREDYIGILNMPLTNSGKVKVGQRVNVSLRSFPDHQFGMLVGKVQKISDVVNENSYQVVIQLPSQLQTNYNIEIPEKEEFIGNAEIITDDLRLIERLFDRIRKNFSNRAG